MRKFEDSLENLIERVSIIGLLPSIGEALALEEENKGSTKHTDLKRDMESSTDSGEFLCIHFELTFSSFNSWHQGF